MTPTERDREWQDYQILRVYELFEKVTGKFPDSPEEVGAWTKTDEGRKHVAGILDADGKVISAPKPGDMFVDLRTAKAHREMEEFERQLEEEDKPWHDLQELLFDILAKSSVDSIDNATISALLHAMWERDGIEPLDGIKQLKQVLDRFEWQENIRLKQIATEPDDGDPWSTHKD